MVTNIKPQSGTAQKPFAFISYRERDALPYARALYEAIESEFGRGSVFLDFRSIPPASEWRPDIENACKKTTLMIVVIGPGWLESLKDPEHQSVEKDWVRKELICALKRRVNILPVAVGGASVPRREQLPPELQDLAGSQAEEIREKLWHEDVPRLLKQMKQYGFKSILKAPWTIIQFSIFLVIVGGSFALASVLDVGTLVTVPLAIFVCVAMAVLWNLFSLFFVGVDLGPELPPEIRRVRTSIVSVSGLVLCASLIGLWLSLFFGVPVDMRDRLNPKLIRRVSRPAFSGLQVPTPVGDAFSKPANSGQGEDAEIPTSMSKFTQWVDEGAKSGGGLVYVYRFHPEQRDYYKAFDATIEFPALDEVAQLAEGAAFLVQSDNAPVDWRQVSLWISSRNTVNTPPQPTLQNELRSVQMDPGDTLMLILKFQAAPTKQKDFLKTKLDAYKAKIVVKP